MAQDKEIGCTIWDPGNVYVYGDGDGDADGDGGGSGNPKVSVNCAFFSSVLLCLRVNLSVVQCVARSDFVWPSVWFVSLCLFSLH